MTAACFTWHKQWDAQLSACLARQARGSRVRSAPQNARTLSASLACMPCYQSECALEDALPKPCCMNALSVERVHNELMSML